jgi:PmbA protein
MDDPLRPKGLGSYPFDAEGVASRPCPVINEGVLQQWFLTSASARRLGLQPTGHAHRSPSSLPIAAPSNFYLQAGLLSPQELMADIEEGVYITSLMGQGVNLVTGDYSRGASGFLIEKGEITRPIHEVTLVGHLLSMFQGLTPANDLTFRYQVNAPTVRIDGMMVAGE